MHHSERVSLLANQRAINADSEQLIASSWRRCLGKHQLDPDTPPRLQVLETQHLRERSQRHDYLMGVSQQELVDLYNQLQGSGFNIFLTDAEGIILQQVCDPVYTPALRRAGALLGADWSEPHSGTNGVGTCIVEQRPLTVHLDDHFHTKHVSLSCTAAPIRDPEGELLAVLDCSTASIQTPQVDKHILGLVRNSATFIEGLYFLRLHRSDLIIHLGINPDIVPQPRNAMLAVSPSGRITGANPRALLALGVNDRRKLLGREIQHVLDLRCQPLSASAAGQIHQLRLVDRGTPVYATWQVPAPKPANRGGAQAPLSELSPLARAEPPPLRWGDSALEAQIAAAGKLYNEGLNLLLQGESGTGKDTLARALHEASPLAPGLFVCVDGGDGALAELEGLFAEPEDWHSPDIYPEGGTVFLNDLHLLCERGQQLALELLRRLERCNARHPKGFQVIGASRERLAERAFSGELYYRVAQFELELAPLRERDALEELATQLLHGEGGGSAQPPSLDAAARQALLRHPWQGNTRELQNTLRSLAILHPGGRIGVAELPPGLGDAEEASSAAKSAAPAAWTGLEAAEYKALLHELREREWNISATAKALGMSRNTLYRRMEKYGIQVGL